MAVDDRMEESAGAPRTAPRISLRHGVMQAGPLALAGILANGGSVIVTIVLARVLVSEDYGTLNQLLGVFFVVSTPGSALLVAVVRRVASWQESERKLADWAKALHRRAGWALGGFAVVLAAAGPALAALLGRNDPAGLDAIALAGAVWVALCVDRGLLQARRQYRTLSWNLVCEGALRTACMVTAGLAGLGVTGVAAGVLAAELATSAQARMMAVRPWRRSGEWARRSGEWARRSGERARRSGECACRSGERARREGWALRRDVRRWTLVRGRRALGHVVGGGTFLSRRDVVAAVVALAAVALLQNVDVIVMGKEGPHQAGAYAAVSVSSKVLVFLALVVGGYLLPEAAHAWREGGQALRQLWVALGLVEVPGVLLAGIAAVAPRRFLATFFSARYVGAAPAFLPLAGAMALLSLVVLVTMYLLAIGDRRVAVLLVVAGAAATAAVVLAHGSPRSTASADLAVQGSLAVLALAELAVAHRGRSVRGPAVDLVASAGGPGMPDPRRAESL